MDLSQSIIYGSLTASVPTATANTPLTGVVFDDVDFSDVEVRRYLDDRAIQDGKDAADVYLGARRILIDAAIYGSSPGDLWDRQGDFVSAFNPVIAYNSDTAAQGFLPLKFYRPTADISTWPTSTYPYGIPLQIYARSLVIGRFRVNRKDTSNTSSRGLSLRSSVVLEARDPRIYLQSTTAISVPTATSTFTNRGNHPSFPILTFAVTAAGETAARFYLEPGSLILDLSTETTGTFTVDYANRTITDSSGTRRDDLFSTASGTVQYFAQAQPGVNTCFRSNQTGVSSATWTLREAWL